MDDACILPLFSGVSIVITRIASSPLAAQDQRVAPKGTSPREKWSLVTRHSSLVISAPGTLPHPASPAGGRQAGSHQSTRNYEPIANSQEPNSSSPVVKRNKPSLIPVNKDTADTVENDRLADSSLDRSDLKVKSPVDPQRVSPACRQAGFRGASPKGKWSLVTRSQSHKMNGGSSPVEGKIEPFPNSTVFKKTLPNTCSSPVGIDNSPFQELINRIKNLDFKPGVFQFLPFSVTEDVLKHTAQSRGFVLEQMPPTERFEKKWSVLSRC
jgi:hypothetical protein